MADPTVHVIDDDDAVRESLVFLLESSGFSAIGYASATDFLSALSGQPKGCVITDIRMPGMTGLDLLRHLSANKCVNPVIVMTGHGDVPLAVEAMKAGAADFIEKPFQDELILSAVRAALQQMSEDLDKSEHLQQIMQRLDSLSSREREVLQGLVAGHPNKTIAHDLDISPRTVEVYRANLMTKMRAGSLSELIRMALVAGL